MPNKTLKKWSCSRLKEITSLKQSKDEVKSLSDTQLVSFVPMECLGINKKYFNSNFEKPIKDLINKYVYFAENDVIMAKITPCFENGKIGIAKNLKNKIGFGSSEYLVFRPNKNVLNEYLYYYLNRNSFREIGAQNMQGAVGHKRLSKEFIEETLIYYPAEIEEQQRIVQILDETFENIEKAKQNALQNLNNAKELFESRLNKTFLNIDKNVNKKLSELAQIIGGGTPSKDNKSFYIGDIPWATVRDMNTDLLTETEFLINEDAVKNSSTNIIPAGNIIIATRVGLGKVCILAQDTAINQDLKGIIPVKQITSKFLFWWFKSIKNKIVETGVGATVKGVKLPFIQNLDVPFIDIKEQQKIVAQLDELQEQTKKLEQIYEQKIKDLDELKQSILQKAFNGEL